MFQQCMYFVLVNLQEIFVNYVCSFEFEKKYLILTIFINIILFIFREYNSI